MCSAVYVGGEYGGVLFETRVKPPHLVPDSCGFIEREQYLVREGFEAVSETCSAVFGGDGEIAVPEENPEFGDSVVMESVVELGVYVVEPGTVVDVCVCDVVLWNVAVRMEEPVLAAAVRPGIAERFNEWAFLSEVG